MAVTNLLKNSEISISGAIAFKESRGKRYFLVTKIKDENGWEFPKVTVRRGESSVRAVLRMTTEQAGMSARILEEAGRTSSVVTISGKTVNQKTYYYLLMQRSGGEVIGFPEFDWLEYVSAGKKLTAKKEKNFLKDAREVLKTWEKNRKPKSL